VTAHAVDVVQEMVAKAALNVLSQGISSTFDQWPAAREGVSHPVQVPEQVCPAPVGEARPWAYFVAGTAAGALALAGAQKAKEWLKKKLCPRRARTVGVQAQTTYNRETDGFGTDGEGYAVGRVQALGHAQQRTSVEVGQPFAYAN
jgi:hypothetical protein